MVLLSSSLWYEGLIDMLHFFFFQILENEIFKFEEQICDFEEDLSNEAIDFQEDVHAEVLTAIGKAKLLMSQKLAQFRGLCEKNIVSIFFPSLSWVF